ncbi:I cysteine dioxygenase [Tupanvirus soda lake]|uniref:I cysteine dioxygenase n=1 Tax=Tupanvirus deep ocean TaxID=2126984 RepID=A0A2K9L3C9_9VIRU|nr:I cysteine dioxygenase [Tupanvirus soda lake]AUL77709.2 I cysteine dioxygenase [Tupanvirus soda lake]
MSNINTLDSLCNELLSEFKTNKPLENLKHILERYNGNDWSDYVKYNNNTYHKKLLFQTPYFDMYIICWKQSQQTKIHDHPSNGCLMKVLKGKLIEDLYKNNDDLSYVKSNILEKNKIGYRIDNIILHQISAPCDSVSLHIYSPKGYQPKYYDESLFFAK